LLIVGSDLELLGCLFFVQFVSLGNNLKYKMFSLTNRCCGSGIILFNKIQ
jgi:hypothetical protein